MGALAAFFFILPLPPITEHVVVSAPAAVVSFAASSTDLPAERLRFAGCCASDWLRFARVEAGVLSGQSIVAVDGVETGSLPSATEIERIRVNADPFSAEFSSPGVNRIEISTRAPSRRMRWSAGTDALGAGGTDRLSGARSEARGRQVSLGGGVPRSPIVFLTSAQWSRDAVPASIVAPDGAATPATTNTESWRLSTSFWYTARSTEWRFRHAESRSRTRNAGVGGIAAIETGVEETLARREFALSALHRVSWAAIRIAAGGSTSTRISTGDVARQAVEIPGTLAGGSATVERDESTRRTVTLAVIADGQGRFDRVQLGVQASSFDQHLQRAPNPNGTLLIDSQNPSSTTLFLSGPADARARVLEAAVFANASLVRRRRIAVRSGVRVDFQSHDTVRVSPRIAASWLVAGFRVNAATGVFAPTTPPEVFARINLRATGTQDAVIVDGNALASFSAGLDPGYRRRRDVVARASIARSIRGVQLQAESTLTHATFAASMIRWPSENGWEDRLTPAFQVRRYQLQLSGRWSRGDHMISGHVLTVHASDQTNGPFEIHSASALPAWARSAGISPLNASLMASVKLPAALQLTVTGIARAKTPFDITTGELGADYARTLRGGLPRNSGALPAHCAIDASVLKDVRTPAVLAKMLGARVSVGLRVENLLNSRQVTGVGDVLGSPLLGRPLAMLPSRSARVWITF